MGSWSIVAMACFEDCEECDNGTMDAVDDSPGVCGDSMDDACRTNCKEAHCGDGVIDSNEVCDDLNDLDGDVALLLAW